MENESFRHKEDEIMVAKSQVAIKETNCLKPYLKCPFLLSDFLWSTFDLFSFG